MKYILLFFIIFISGCSSTNLVQQDEKSYAQRMMISEECSNACWLAIEPGMIIERQKISAILSNEYGNENVHYSENGSGVVWYITSSSVFPEIGNIEISEKNQIESIQIILQDNQIPIDDIVAAFGKPEVTVIVNPSEAEDLLPCGLARLVYPTIGLQVSTNSATKIKYADMISISKPFSVSEAQVSKELEMSLIELVIDWDERDKYCLNTTPSSP